MFLLTHLLRFSVRHPRLVLTIVGAITICAAVFIPRIQLRLDGRSLIPSGLPQFAEGDQAASRFELRDLVLIGVGNEESGVYTAETLQRIARLSEGLSKVDGVVEGSVISLSTVPRIALVDKSGVSFTTMPQIALDTTAKCDGLHFLDGLPTNSISAHITPFRTTSAKTTATPSPPTTCDSRSTSDGFSKSLVRSHAPFLPAAHSF